LTVAAVVLAAGAASRFGAAKQQLLLPRVLERIAPLLADGTLAEAVVVEGAHALDAARLPAGVRLVPCPSWASGPGASLRCGLAALGAETQAAVVLLADGPRLSADAVRRVLAARLQEDDEARCYAASYAGFRGHPLVIGRAAWASIPDEGLRGVTPVLVPCDDLGDPGDVDTPADLDALDG